MPIDTDLAACLSKQADHERFAASAYTALANWCENEDFSGFAEFFHKQAAEELEHAAKFHKHMVDRSTLPMLGALDAPACQFDSLPAAARAALQLEVANTAGIHTAYAMAVDKADYPAQTLLHWFIAEQVEEEAWANKMVTMATRAACSGAILYLDRHIVKALTE